MLASKEDISLKINEDDIRIEYFRGHGPGGQHRNVTESAVRIRHMPTGIVVQASERRSQWQNRALAMERLRQALVNRSRVARKRIPSAVPLREKEKRIAQKHREAAKKKLRDVRNDE